MSGGSFTVTGMSASEPSGERVFGPTTIQGQQVIGETLALALQGGDNSVTVPGGATAVWIQAPVNGSATLLLRTSVNPNDTGLAINGTGAPTIYPFPVGSTPTTLIIASSAEQTPPVTLAFI